MVVGILIAIAASACFEFAYVLQALEVRELDADLALRGALMRRLMRRRRWLAGTALTALAGGLQVLALSDAPLTVVQPTLSLGLVLLLVLGRRFLGERVGLRERLAVAAIIAGVVVIGLSAPRKHDATPAGLAIPLAMSALGLLVLGPFLLRSRTTDPRIGVLGAAAGDSWATLAIKLVADELGQGHWLSAAAWGVGAGVSGSLALASEMSALQRLAATRVAPLVLAAQVVIPVGLAPVVAHESWGDTPLGGTVLGVAVAIVASAAAVLGASRAVGSLRAERGEAVEDDGGRGGQSRE